MLHVSIDVYVFLNVNGYQLLHCLLSTPPPCMCRPVRMMAAIQLAMLSIICMGFAASACETKPVCPPGYDITYPDTSNPCGYSCMVGAKPQCLPLPYFNPATRSWLTKTPTAQQLKASKAIPYCGGTTGPLGDGTTTPLPIIPCPTIACATSSSWAISGPLGAC